MSRKLSILLLILFVGQFANTSYASPSGDNIIITEVLYDAPSSDPTEEWFELFNPTDSAVDLTGWTIEDNFASIPLSGSIPAKGYLVVAADATGFNNLYGSTPDISGSWGSFALKQK